MRASCMCVPGFHGAAFRQSTDLFFSSVPAARSAYREGAYDRYEGGEMTAKDKVEPHLMVIPMENVPVFADAVHGGNH